MLRRARYPAPLLSAGLVAVSITSAAALASAVQATSQEDDYADLTLALIVMVWMLPALLALLVATALLRYPVGTAGHRTATYRTAAGIIVAIGAWFVAMPFAAGVDSDSLPVMLVVAGAPGVVLFGAGRWHSFTTGGGDHEAGATRPRA